MNGQYPTVEEQMEIAKRKGEATFAEARGSEASSVNEALNKEAWAIATTLAQIGNGWSWKDDLKELMQRACAWDSNVKKAMPPNDVSTTPVR